MSGTNTTTAKLSALTRRRLVAVAKACKAEGLCGPYSVLRKQALVDLLSKIPAEQLAKHLVPSRRHVVWANRLEVLAWLGVLSIVITALAWVFPLNTQDSKNLAASIAQAGKLTEELAKQIEKNDQLTMQRDQLVVGISREIVALSDQTAEMKATSQKLASLLADIEKNKKAPITGDAEVTLRLANAAIALADKRYEETLRLLPQSFLAERMAAAENKVSEAATAATLRGLALEDTGAWIEAIDVYKQISALSSDIYFRLKWAYCLSMAGYSKKAIEQLDELINIAKAISKPTPHDTLALAAAYKMRGATLGGQDRFREAIEDLKTAIDLFSKLPNSSLPTITCWINLGIFSHYLDRSQSHLAFDMAEKLLRDAKLSEDDRRDLIIMIRNHRAGQFSEEGKIEDAISAAESAVEMRRAELRDHDSIHRQLRLAESLNNLGTIYSNCLEKQKAISTLTEALNLTKKLIDAGQHDAISTHIYILVNRATVFDELGDSYAAAEDATAAIEISDFLNAFASDHRNPIGRRCLAHALCVYAEAVRKLGAHQNALEKIEQAIKIYEQLETDGFREITYNRLSALNTQGMIYLALNRKADAVSHFNRLVALCEEAIVQSPTAQRESLRLTIRANYAECLTAESRDRDAKDVYEATLSNLPTSYPNSPVVRQGIARTKSALALLLCVSVQYDDPARALKLANEAHVECDSLWQVSHVLAVARAENGDFAGAIEAEDETLKKCPERFKPLATSVIAGFKDRRTLRQQREKVSEKGN